MANHVCCRIIIMVDVIVVVVVVVYVVECYVSQPIKVID